MSIHPLRASCKRKNIWSIYVSERGRIRLSNKWDDVYLRADSLDEDL